MLWCRRCTERSKLSIHTKAGPSTGLFASAGLTGVGDESDVRPWPPCQGFVIVGASFSLTPKPRRLRAQSPNSVIPPEARVNLSNHRSRSLFVPEFSPPNPFPRRRDVILKRPGTLPSIRMKKRFDCSTNSDVGMTEFRGWVRARSVVLCLHLHSTLAFPASERVAQWQSGSGPKRSAVLWLRRETSTVRGQLNCSRSADVDAANNEINA